MGKKTTESWKMGEGSMKTDKVNGKVLRAKGMRSAGAQGDVSLNGEAFDLNIDISGMMVKAFTSFDAYLKYVACM